MEGQFYQISMETITLICGVLLCVVGIASFVTGLLSKAKESGALTAKVDLMLDGVDKIQDKLNANNEWKEETGKILSSHDERIKANSKDIQELKEKLK